MTNKILVINDKTKEEGRRKFLEALQEGIPAVIYPQHICSCMDSYPRTRILHDAITQSRSKIIGVYECEGERRLTEESWKLFVRPHENPTPESIVREIVRYNEEVTINDLLNEVLVQDSEYKERFLRALTGIQNPKLIDRQRIATELEKVIEDKRLVKINNLSYYLGRKDRENGHRLSISHIDVSGAYLISTQGEVVGIARSKVLTPIVHGSLLKDFYKRLEPHGIRANSSYSTSLEFAIAGIVESGSGLGSIYTRMGEGDDFVSYSLHQDTEENEKFRQKAKQKFQSLREAPEKYKSLVQAALA
ncbi:MAG: hypothetical protein WC796_03450 [Candidatus Pacearchaeota archaeon]|jgi:hypothetical protein